MTIVAQIQNLRGFVTNNLSDVIDWNKHVKIDEGKTTGDIAFVEIKTPFNRYKLSMGSAYAQPPHGAPDVCRSLGWVTFDHIGHDKHVLGPKNELTYRDISGHINSFELEDALADARRKVAEAGGLEVADARMKLREIAARAEKYGIKVNLPEEPAAPQFKLSESVSLPSHHGVPIRTVDVLPSSGPAPFIGAPVIYYGSDRIAGMDQIPGTIVKVQRDGRVAVHVTADLNEITFIDNVHRRGTDAGNGRVHTTQCWDFNPEWLKEQERIAALERKLADTDENPSLVGRVARLEEELLVAHRRLNAVDLEQIYAAVRRQLLEDPFTGGVSIRLHKLEGAVIALEAAVKDLKPRRGRPPKAELAEMDRAIGEEALRLGRSEGGETEGAELASELGPEDAQ